MRAKARRRAFARKSRDLVRRRRSSTTRWRSSRSSRRTRPAEAQSTPDDVGGERRIRPPLLRGFLKGALCLEGLFLYRPDSHLRRGPRESAEVIGLAAQRNACPGLLTQHRKNGGARRTEHLDPRGGLQRLRIRSSCTFSNDLHVELH